MDSPNRIEEEAAAATRDARRSADATRAWASETLDKARATARDLRDDVLPAFDALADRMQELTARGKAAASDASAQARVKLDETRERTSAYVAEKPLQSMAIAAAAGAVLALLLGRRRR